MDAILGSVLLFGGNFAPRNWALCQGQILAISQNTALFSLLGTVYGGDGRTTFALPDLQGRAVISQGAGPGLSDYVLGEVGGAETTTLLTIQLPVHSHPVNMTITPGSSTAATTALPTTAVYAPDGGGNPAYSGSPTNPMAPYSATLVTGITGSSIPFGNRNPYLGITYMICTSGIFPARN
jgi:microcystin-dependent protein